MEIAIAAAIGGGFALIGTVYASFLNRATAQRLEEFSHTLERITQHDTERHRFRHQMGQFAARERLEAYVELAALAMAAYRAKIGKEWNDEALMAEAAEAANALLNYYYDHRFFFTEGKDGVEGAVKSLVSGLKLDFPDVETVEANLRRVSGVVRKDLLLDELADSAVRAIDHGAPGTVTVTTP